MSVWSSPLSESERSIIEGLIRDHSGTPVAKWMRLLVASYNGLEDECERLRAVVKRLTADLDDLIEHRVVYVRTAEAEAECVTLRQALAAIQSMAGHPDAAQGCRNIIAAARAVLAGTEKPQ